MLRAVALQRSARRLLQMTLNSRQDGLLGCNAALRCGALRASSRSSNSGAGNADGKPAPSAGSGGIFGRLQAELDAAAAGDAALKAALSEASSPASNAAAGGPERANSAATSAAGPKQKEPAAAAGAPSSTRPTPASEPSSESSPRPPARTFKLWEDVKDVLAVTFGMERRRDIAAEYASGERPYPWITYVEPISGKAMFRNTESGIVTEIQPPDWADFSSPSSSVTANVDATAVSVVAPEVSRWERTMAAVASTPVISAMLSVGSAVAAGPVGQAVGAARERVADRVEDLREKWETSQHPLVVNASYLVDNFVAETEQGRALTAIGAVDPVFEPYSFVKEMTEELLPKLARAFFRADMPVLRALCKDSALAQMKAVRAAREVEGLTHDGIILSVRRVEIAGARTLEMTGDKGGSMPVILLTSQVQYIHCVRNKKGEIVEGAESEIRAGVLVTAVTREYDPGTGHLEWKVVEMSLQGATLYL